MERPNWRRSNQTCWTFFIHRRDCLHSRYEVSGTGDKLIKLWNASSGKLEATLKGHIGTVRSLVISEDGSILYSGSWDHSIRVWNLLSKTCLAVWKGILIM